MCCRHAASAVSVTVTHCKNINLSELWTRGEIIRSLHVTASLAVRSLPQYLATRTSWYINTGIDRQPTSPPLLVVQSYLPAGCTHARVPLSDKWLLGQLECYMHPKQSVLLQGSRSWPTSHRYSHWDTQRLQTCTHRPLQHIARVSARYDVG